MIIVRDNLNGKRTKIRFWKFELLYEESEKVYIGNWKFGNRIVGSFTIIKK